MDYKKIPLNITLIYFLFATTIIFSQQEHNQLTIEADYIAYAVDKNIILSTGNVILIIGEIKINASSLQLDINERFLEAQNNIVISNPYSTLEGDFLQLNLVTFQGEIIKISKKVEMTYFISKGLNIIHTPIEKLNYDIEIPDLTQSSLSLVAKKISLTFGSDRMSLDDVKFYIKGKKVASLPHYSTDVAVALAAIPFKLENISYSSKNKWEIDSSFHYAKGKNNGYIDIRYKSEGGRKKEDTTTLYLTQHFTLGKNKDGSLRINRLGEGKKQDYHINYRHFFNKYVTMNFAASYYLHKKNINARINTTLRFKNSHMTLFLNVANLDKKPKYNYNFNINSYSILDKDTKIHHTWKINIEENHKETVKRITFNIYRSGVYLTDTTSLNMNTNISHTLSKKSVTTLYYSVSLIKRLPYLASLLTCGYSYNLHKRYKKTTTKNLSFSLATGKSDKWHNLITTSYDLEKKKFGSITNSLQLKPTKLLRIIVSGTYNKNVKPHWTNITLITYYQLFGIKDRRRLETTWDIKKKEYSIGLNTRI